MGAVFRRRANSIAIAVVIGVPLGVLALWAVLYAYARSDFWTLANMHLNQPVPFSHQHHVGGLGIDCRYCHTSVESAAFAGIPPTQTCMTCHSQIWKDAPVLQPVRDSWNTGSPIKWTRVHDLPDYVYFNHSIHVNKGVACQNCHGRVDRMPLEQKVESLQMRWCLDCHNRPQDFIRAKAEEFEMKDRVEVNPPGIGQKLLKENRVEPAGLTDCYTCHR
jgi:hypothetical protein